jgi:hypothetical protein
LQDKPLSTIRSVLDEAFEQGINLMDVFMSQPQVRMTWAGRSPPPGAHAHPGHIGAGWVDGQYCQRAKAGAVPALL